MKTLIIFIIFISVKVIAEDCVSCTKPLEPNANVVQNITDLENSLKINCDIYLDNQVRKEYDDNFSNSPKIKSNIKGLNLEGSKDEIQFLTKMLGDKPNDKWASAKGCGTVVCALTKIYDSEETAYRVLNIAKRDGYIVSLGKDFKFDLGQVGQLFSPKEIKNIDLIYKRLPSKYKKLKTLDRLKRMPDGYKMPNSPLAAAYASPGFKSFLYNSEGEITFLDSGTDGDLWSSFVAIHELTHHIDFSRSSISTTGYSESPEFLKISGWKKSKSYKTDEKTGKKVEVLQWSHANDKKFTRDYAASSPVEDFAEAGANYVLSPVTFKELDPEKYEYMKNNVFEGKEYINEPGVDLAPSELLNSCINKYSEINLYGQQFPFKIVKADKCTDEIVENFNYLDPAQCELNKEVLKNYLNGKIEKEINLINIELSECDSRLGANRTSCFNEGNFKNSCAVDKCVLRKPINNKVKYNILSMSERSYLKAVADKIGRENILAISLINGLSDKKNISTKIPLNIQSGFLNNSLPSLVKKFDESNLKFDSPEKILADTKSYIMNDEIMSNAYKSFQENVLKKASRNKKDNLELIKVWAESQSLNDSSYNNDLAETLTSYGSIWKFK